MSVWHDLGDEEVGREVFWRLDPLDLFDQEWDIPESLVARIDSVELGLEHADDFILMNENEFPFSSAEQSFAI